jgi:hypothetical protein
VVGSPTRPVMPNLIVLWKMGPLRGEGRAGARLWLREATRRDRGGIGPGSKPGAAGDTPGQLQEGKARRSAGGYFLAKKVSALESSSGPVGPIESVYPFIAMSPFAGVVGRQLECWCHWCASQEGSRQTLQEQEQERNWILDCVAATSFAIQPSIKGKRPGKYESTYVPMHHIHPHCSLHRTVPHLMLPCDLQMSGTETRICGR